VRIFPQERRLTGKSGAFFAGINFALGSDEKFLWAGINFDLEEHADSLEDVDDRMPKE
jgi:hypothetical protein